MSIRGLCAGLWLFVTFAAVLLSLPWVFHFEVDLTAIWPYVPRWVQDFLLEHRLVRWR